MALGTKNYLLRYSDQLYNSHIQTVLSTKNVNLMIPTEQDIAAQLDLLQAHRMTLTVYLRQVALVGELSAPPAVINGIHKAREEINRIKQVLHDWKITVDEHPDDNWPQLKISGQVETYKETTYTTGSTTFSELISHQSTTLDFNENRSYREQQDMYRDLAKYIDRYGAKEAVLIQYSGKMAINLLRKLLLKEATVKMYVQNPLKAISRMQSRRIMRTIKELSGELRGTKNCQLVVYDYDVPASVRGASIDKQVLAIGWYTYDHDIDAKSTANTFRVAGHDVPGMLLFANTIEYEIYNAMFVALIDNYENSIRSLGKKPLKEFHY